MHNCGQVPFTCPGRFARQLGQRWCRRVPPRVCPSATCHALVGLRCHISANLAEQRIIAKHAEYLLLVNITDAVCSHTYFPFVGRSTYSQIFVRELQCIWQSVSTYDSTKAARIYYKAIFVEEVTSLSEIACMDGAAAQTGRNQHGALGAGPDRRWSAPGPQSRRC